MKRQPLQSVLAAGAVCCLLGWAAAGPAPGQVIRLAVDARPCNAGADVEVPVSVRQPAGLGALEVEVVYDPKLLELRDVTKGQLLSNAMLGHKVLAPGRVRCDLISAEPIHGNGALFVVHFRAGGTPAQTTIELDSPQAWDHARILEMRVQTEAGQLAIKPSAAAGGEYLGWILGGVGAAAALAVVFHLGRRSSRRAAQPRGA